MATEAAAGATTEERIECYICCELLIVPKGCPECQECICSECLDTWFLRGKTTCPWCRAETTLPEWKVNKIWERHLKKEVLKWKLDDFPRVPENMTSRERTIFRFLARSDETVKEQADHRIKSQKKTLEWKRTMPLQNSALAPSRVIPVAMVIGRKLIGTANVVAEGTKTISQGTYRGFTKVSILVEIGFFGMQFVWNLFRWYRNEISLKEFGEIIAEATAGSVFGVAGAAAGGKMGASLGVTFGPVGAFVGCVVGVICGSFGGDYVGRQVARKMLGIDEHGARKRMIEDAFKALNLKKTASWENVREVFTRQTLVEHPERAVEEQDPSELAAKFLKSYTAYVTLENHFKEQVAQSNADDPRYVTVEKPNPNSTQLQLSVPTA